MRDAALGCPSSVFSWQITPVEALLAYLQNDFKGMMEREHLAPHKRTVINTVYLTEHHHEFDVDTTEETLSTQFLDARKRHDAMCFRTKRMMTDDEPTLFVLAKSKASADQQAEIESRLRHFNPAKDFRVLTLETPDVEGDWRGSDESWNAAFSDVTFDRNLKPAEKAWAVYVNAKCQVVRFAEHVKKGRF
ncbi:MULTISPECIES: hypothetical protein [unclassified Rhizobium]|uniref:hypothetical protein n=1 Tax=unclassified Rhizobium TaxID=2613769 RepID=UPI00177E37AB|nr:MULTISPECIES: hypothetical protein [unclassified Rhizobium]MBD8686075.1 hypothetical protein [Rhizobium sp. CFBP 13644]MBD8690252.1 hypothetical protein [Rhizobium sp. CFBP 13717]